MPLSNEQQRTLLQLALDSIREGWRSNRPLPVDLDRFEESLRAERACFVTLNLHGNLRGCIGHLEALQPLARDVVENAYAAAFNDPRFPPLHPQELQGLELHISILTPAEPLLFQSEADLLAQLRPGVDGLILQEGYRRGTFLPSVWEQLPDRESFWSHLKRKAGLPVNHWSDSLRVYRYQTESFGAEVSSLSA